ncbi:hypothetical protein BDV23DRAFT_56825 [Aspergillus alliaceus]|uniref:Uncharacterized protein n=1 Tax=Petromyces alliaceus TaxID=209559 RepID=A0A5N6G8P9_PETAA|nr:uncharacterized protein BDW43DRAFT_116485 [Aspergillus alliaceus]KAB8238438.1 hypothetical protein BDW43DRAFT_116485 [Aspergillus alliaceus]KAE8392292.1 hypothetical protein BDV23DRAFT_56825 [Aspergillus alliaceus]
MAMDGWISTSNDTRMFISRSLVGLYLPLYNIESCTTVYHRTQSTTTYVKDTLQNSFAEGTKIAFSSPPCLGCEPLQHGPVCRKESTGQLRHPQVLFSVPAVE